AVLKIGDTIVEDMCHIRKQNCTRNINVAELDAVVEGLELIKRLRQALNIVHERDLILFVDNTSVVSWLIKLDPDSCPDLSRKAVTHRLKQFVEQMSKLQLNVRIKWVPSDSCETEAGAREQLGDVDAVLVPGGFGVRGIEGKLGALKFAREQRIPTLGICLGLQCMVIEYARNIVGLGGASSTEFDPEAAHPVIATMAEQVEILKSGEMGGTMRLGRYTAKLQPGSIVESLYDAPTSEERHRHRYEVNNSYRSQIAEAGLVFSGTSPDDHLVEYVELPREVHPFYVATQAHPEFKSRPTHAHPLFAGLIVAALERQESTRLFEVEADA
ncbi:MAG: hypothetical protein EBY26_04030, partial [Microbacteriaceae bacterium]|nr:hypothetical protein [Microbacteriaceae bacterium]